MIPHCKLHLVPPLTLNGGGFVTVTANNQEIWDGTQPPVSHSFFVKLVGRPMTLIFDFGGTMGTNPNLKPKVTLKDGVTGKVIDRTKYTSLSVTYSITNSVTGTTNATESSGTVNTGTGQDPAPFTLTVSVSDTNSEPAKRYVPRTASATITVDSSKTGQTIKVYDGGSGSFGLRDLPLSRKPIMIGKMFEATSSRILPSRSVTTAKKIVNLTKSDLSGTDAKIVFNVK